MSNPGTTPAQQHYLSTTREPVIRVIWRYRQLLLSLVSRDIKVKYQRSVLGLLWTLLDPLLTVLIFVAVFTSILNIRVEGFWAFFVSGLFAWQFISASIVRSTTVLRSHGGLRRSVAFPSEIVVLSTLFAKLFEFLVEIVIVLLAIVFFYHHGVPVTVVLLPLLILFQVLMAAGLMFALSVISVLFHDIEHALPAVMRLLFFLTPIMYPISMIPENVRPYAYLNPFAGLLQLYHTILYEGVWPTWELIGLVSATSVVVFFAGFWIFQRFKDICVEIA